VNGWLNGGALEVENQATLGGSGTILDPVTVDGSLAPGSSAIGTLTINNSVTFQSDGAAVMKINRAAAQNADLLSATSVNYGGGTLTVTNIGATLHWKDTFQLFTGAISGTFAATNLPALASTNFYWDTSLLNGGTIKVAAFEPPTAPTSTASVSGTNLVLGVAPCAPGITYVLQATPSLAPPVTWTTVQTLVAPDGAVSLNFMNPITPEVPQQFFRAIAQ
jgi:hypothetical protein